MNTRSRYFILILFTFLIGCKKYEEDTKAQFSPARIRLSAGQFIAKGYLYKGNFYPARDIYKIDFKTNGTYLYFIGDSSKTPTDKGKWHFDDHKNDVAVTLSEGIGGPYPFTFTMGIEKLSDRKYNFTRIIDNEKYEYIYERK